MAYTNIDKCGLYQDDYREWSRKTRSDKTWGNFKAHFTWAFKETQRSSITSNTKGYVAHVHAEQANAELLTEMQQDHTLALANLATTTQADRTSVALLTKTILELSGQVVLPTSKLTTAQAESARMKNRDSNQPHPGMDIGRPATRLRQILTQVKIKTYILEADIGLTLMGTAPPTDTRWRIRTRWQHIASQSMATTSHLHN